MQENILEIVKFDEKGLVPAIAQDFKTGQVLMFAWMNQESLNATIETKFAHYFSRSRGKLWKKGETSGHTQIVKEVLIDCDNDCLILKIEQNGVACHTGAKSCFFRNLVLTAVVFLMMFSGDVYAGKAKKVNNLVVFAEENITYPLVEIARLYSKQKGSIVSINFDSHQLVQNIDDGEPVDVSISSHQSMVETLKQKGLVDVYSLTNIAEDKLLLIASKNNKKLNVADISQSDDLAKILQVINDHKVPLIIDSAETSLGKYTDDILSKAKITNQKFYRRIVEDTKSIAGLVNENNEYCGIVLASSVKNYDNIVVLKEIENSEIYYQAIVVAGDNMDKARDFLKFVKSSDIKKIFSDSGFVVD